MLYIHCGLHKTGSTAIQESLRRDSRKAVSYNSESYHKLSQQDLDAKWTAEVLKANAKKHLVLSCEAALGSMASAYDDAKARAESIRLLFSSAELCVIVYFRPHLPWLESVYTQLIQQGEYLSPQEFVQNMLGRSNLYFTSIAKILHDVFGRESLNLRAFSQHCIVSDFYSVLGLAPPQTVPRRNSSLSPARLAIMRELNKTGSDGDSQRHRQLLQREIKPIQPATKCSPFPEDIQLQIQATFAEDWCTLSEYLDNQDVMLENRPFKHVGHSVEDIEVMQEAIHIIKEVSLKKPPSTLEKILRKLEKEPSDFLPAVIRRLRGI